ncbi:MAG TPA: hypothetical protein DDY68_06170 [Porphyromonadaceae bacterium]|nr:hypothetical protein [Porphyromonadaceae bacterium]
MRGGDDRYDRNASGKMFSLKDVNGNTIRYYIISDTAVHVVNKATSGDYYVWKNSGDDSKAYKGDIVIPETVTHPDTKKKYKVTGLWCLNDSNGTFDQCTQLRSVYLPKYIEKIFITSMFSYCYNLRYVVINSKFKGFHGGVEISE